MAEFARMRSWISEFPREERIVRWRVEKGGGGEIERSKGSTVGDDGLDCKLMSVVTPRTRSKRLLLLLLPCFCSCSCSCVMLRLCADPTAAQISRIRYFTPVNPETTERGL